VAWVIWLALLAGAISAHAVEAVVSYPKVTIANRKVLNLDGKELRFREDVIGPGPAIVSFTYMGCQSVCPVSDLVMNAVEGALGRAARGAPRLVTLTIDPLNDTRERLAARAAEIGSGPARVWLTGDYREVYEVLEGLGIQFGSLEEHEAFFLVIGQGRKHIARVPLSKADPEFLLQLSRRLE
jgi:protein SCO1/2